MGIAAPSRSSSERARSCRERSQASVIVVSELRDEATKIKALEAGVEKHVTKPCSRAATTPFLALRCPRNTGGLCESDARGASEPRAQEDAMDRSARGFGAREVRWLIAAVIAVLLFIFALMNRQRVEIDYIFFSREFGDRAQDTGHDNHPHKARPSAAAPKAPPLTSLYGRAALTLLIPHARRSPLAACRFSRPWPGARAADGSAGPTAWGRTPEADRPTPVKRRGRVRPPPIGPEAGPAETCLPPAYQQRHGGPAGCPDRRSCGFPGWAREPVTTPAGR